MDINRSAYDQIAPAFAKKNADMSRELVVQASRLVERLAASGLRVLDLGCGAGRDIAWFEAHGQRMFGADLSRGMLNEARAVTRAPLSQMDMRGLGFAPASFHAVWCCAALLHLPKSLLTDALAEIRRVLVPGGYFSLSVQKGYSEGVEPSPYLENVERFFARYQPDEIAALLRQAGFSILEQGENEGFRTWLMFDTLLTAE